MTETEDMVVARGWAGEEGGRGGTVAAGGQHEGPPMVGTSVLYLDHGGHTNPYT